MLNLIILFASFMNFAGNPPITNDKERVRRRKRKCPATITSNELKTLPPTMRREETHATTLPPVLPPPLRREEARALANSSLLLDEINLLTQDKIIVLDDSLVKASSNHNQINFPSSQTLLDAAFWGNLKDNDAMENFMANLDVQVQQEAVQERSESPEIFANPQTEEASRFLDGKIYKLETDKLFLETDLKHCTVRIKDLQEEIQNLEQNKIAREKELEDINSEIKNFKYCREKLY